MAPLIVKTVPIASLTIDPANARKHPEKNLDAIRGSLARFGQQKPIVVDSSNVVRAGNGTLEAARSLGWTEIAVIVSDLAGAEMQAFAIADNRTAELATWDDEVLQATLAALGQEDQALLAACGFEDFQFVEHAVREFDESIADDQITKCPQCGHEFHE